MVKLLLKELNYDIISYDAGDIINKVVIDTITTTKMSDRWGVREAEVSPWIGGMCAGFRAHSSVLFVRLFVCLLVRARG